MRVKRKRNEKNERGQKMMMRKEDKKTIEIFFHRVKEIVDKIAAAGVEIDDEETCCILSTASQKITVELSNFNPNT